MLRYHQAKYLSLLIPLCLTLGCSSKKFDTHPVRGVVKFEDGSVVTSGRVEFYNREAQLSARGSIQSDGTFVMGTETEEDGAVAGTHQVLIMQTIAPTEVGIGQRDHGAHIDPSFASFRSSNLAFTVEANQKNVAEFVVRKQE